MASDVLTLRVVSPEKTVFEGEAASVVVPAWDGRMGVLPGHAPVITLLGAGELVIDRPGGGSLTYYIERGVLKVENDDMVVLTDRAAEALPPEGLPLDAMIHPGELELLEQKVTPGNPMA